MSQLTQKTPHEFIQVNFFLDAKGCVKERAAYEFHKLAPREKSMIDLW